MARASNEATPEKNQNKPISSIQFTDTERQWIADNPVVYYSDDTSWQPFVYLNKKNVLEGIGPEFLAHIRRLSKINFQFVSTKTWDQVIKKVKNKEIKLVLATVKTPERELFAEFSEPYFDSKLSIVTGPKYSYIQNLKELYGKTIAAPAGYYSIDYLRARHPEIKIKVVNDVEQAFTAVFDGEADAFVGTMAVAIYRLKNSRFTNLKISGTVDQASEVRFMITKGNSELVSIINKALSQISEKDKRIISNNWFGIEIEQGIDPSIIWKILIAAGIIIFVAILWITQLKREVLLRKQAEKKLRLSREDANKANSAKTEFLANMSHEIRTPMNAIFAFSELLSDTPLNNEQQQYLDSIQVGSSGLLHIINDILEISKIEAGKVTIENRPTDLSRLCDEVKKLFVAPMIEKNLIFSIDMQVDCPQVVLLDGHRLRQILINIVGNAHKFTSQGFVKLKICYTTTDTPSKIDLTFQVSDTGIGIEKDKQALIFDHFVQTHGSIDNPLGGTGLGLSISKKLSEKMNGSLTLSSEPNVGSCFNLTFRDIKITSEKETNNKEIGDIHFNSKTILVVDDVETNRIILGKFLSVYPFEIILATNGHQAIELAKQHQPDLILMDIRMPLMDGYQAAKEIKQDLNTLIIAVTASALDNKEALEKRKDFDDFLRKPISRDKLIESLDRLLNNN